MKHSIAIKSIAIILCALSLVAAVAGGVGVIGAANFNLYSQMPQDWFDNQLESEAFNIAVNYAELYAAEHLGGCSERVLQALYQNSYLSWHDLTWSAYIMENGEPTGESSIITNTANLEVARLYQFSTSVEYPVEVELFNTEYPTESYASEYSDGLPDATQPSRMTEPVDEAVYSRGIDYLNDLGYYETIQLNYYAGPRYDVVVYVEPSVDSGEYQMLNFLYNWRYAFITVILVSLLVFAITLVYLCFAAGKRPGTKEIRPAALNRIPLDIYFLAAGSAICFLIWGCVELIIWTVNHNQNWVFLCLTGLLAFFTALILVAFIYALAAQCKMKNGYWWRRSLCGWCLVKLGVGCKWLFRGARAVFGLLPIMWKWLATAAAMVLCVCISFILGISSWGFGEAFWTLVCVASVLGSIFIVFYGGYCFATLMKGAKQMAEGGLYHQIPTDRLYGDFKEFAEQLNSLAGAARIAAEQQLKSERMKTELITNVSHDIKTPLTSIINYVDLLKKPHTESDGQLYLEVLDRQSLRLKKLIDDLMEMSKASTGNMTVEIGQVDAVEAINQALGEFADKLNQVELSPVFRHPDFPVIMKADGRLVWRVMSNLLSNAVKYAMPGTRLYIDLMVLQGNAVIALKNISRDQLNVNADELMERFVRGDTSRNTEGSGLGLNIAKSLTELQQGQMHLMVDGDLFKVTIILPLV